MNLEQVNELMKVIQNIDSRVERIEKLIPAINKVHLETFHPIAEKEYIDITPICQAISDMTDSMQVARGSSYVVDIIRNKIESMIVLLDKYVNGDKNV